MQTTTELTFRLAVREHLAKLDSLLVEALSLLVEHRYPPQVFALSFEVFSDGFTSRFPVRAFFMDKSNTEYFVVADGLATYPSPIDPDLLAVRCVYPLELEEDAFQAEPELDTWQIATDELIPWFALCWQQAGGAAFQIEATIASHDSSREFDLRSNLWRPAYSAFVC